MPIDQEVRDFSKKVIDEANSKINYPLIVPNIKSKPAVFQISSDSKEEGVKQYVYYITSLKLTDTAALQKETSKLNSNYQNFFRELIKAKR